MANQCGVNAGGELLGESQIISPEGEVVARARSISSPEVQPGSGEELLVVDLSLAGSITVASVVNGVLWQTSPPVTDD